jgi:CheY-like chemotaxis protein
MGKPSAKTATGRILVVEDNADSRDILAKLLRMSGFDVICASDGASGFEAARKQVPDLIITDINMPGMDGLELLRRVRLDPRFEATSVLVVTAFGGEAALEAIEAGADGATAKPFDFDGFVDTVRGLVSLRRQPPED